MTEGKLRVMIVEDSPIYRVGLREIVQTQADMEIVAEAEPGREAVQQARRMRPHVLLMGLGACAGNALEVMRACKGLAHTRVIVLGEEPCRELTRQVLNSRAFGYLPKGVELPELVDAIRSVAQGRRLLISVRELQVLGHVVEGKSLREIAGLLRIREKRVGKVMSATIRNLDANNRTHAVVRAMQRGWIPLYPDV